MEGRGELTVSHSEYVDRHGLEALAGRLCAPKLSYRRSGRFATHDNRIADRLDVFDDPGEVRNYHPHVFEHFGKLIARQELFIRVERTVIVVSRLSQQGRDIFLRRLV